jgi:hypothetical protein
MNSTENLPTENRKQYRRKAPKCIEYPQQFLFAVVSTSPLPFLGFAFFLTCRAFPDMPFWNCAEYRILYRTDFISRNSTKFFTVHYCEIPRNSVEFPIGSCKLNSVYLQMSSVLNRFKNRCLDDPSTDKPTTRHFDPNEASTQWTVCCDNLLLWHSVSRWTDCLSTPNCDILT